jgi:hypothetical protein
MSTLTAISSAAQRAIAKAMTSTPRRGRGTDN